MTSIRSRAIEAAKDARRKAEWAREHRWPTEEKAKRELASLLEELAARLEWRPISEAPGLYRPILAFLPGDWETPWEICVAFQKREGVFARNDDDHLIIEPTHFMLLPEPPSGDAP